MSTTKTKPEFVETPPPPLSNLPTATPHDYETDDFTFTDDDLKLKEKVVKLGSKGDYTLRETDEDAACKWRNMTMSKMKMEDGKFAGSVGIADVEPFLVGACLFDKGGRPVGEAFVRTLPSRIVKQMFDWVQTTSGLKETDAGKEVPNSTPGNSA